MADVIRTLTIRSRTEGVQQAANDLQQLAGSQNQVVAASVAQERTTLSVEKAYQRLQRQLDDAYRAQENLARVAKTLEQAQAQGLVTQERSNELMQAAVAHYNSATQAINTNAIATQKLVAGMSGIGAAALSSSRANDQLTRGMTLAGQAAATANDNFTKATQAINANAAASKNLISGMSQIGRATLDSSRASEQLIKGMSQVGQAATGAAGATDKYGNSSKLARYELINLGRQINDVGVSLVSGQSAFTVLIQQGSQIADVFTSSGISFSNFAKQAISGITSFLTPLRVAIGVIGSFAVAAVTAGLQWADSQQQIKQALTGIGAASGATVESINKIADSSSSSLGLSVSEAREFATALAATGKVAVDLIGPITLLGKDLARAFGIDASAAAKKLADVYSGDLAKGAQDLAQRVGTFNAAIVENIRNMQAQGDQMGAQALLTTTLAKALEEQQRILTTTAGFWTRLGNAISNAWTKFGEVVASGVGPTQTIEQQIDATQKRMDQLRAATEKPFTSKADLGSINEQLAAETENLKRLNAQLDDNAAKTKAAQDARDSFNARQAVIAQQPEVEQSQALQNQLKFLEDIKRKIDEGKLSLEGMGITAEQLATALQRAGDVAANFKSSFQQAKDASELAVRAAAALGPTAKGQIAFEQELNAQRASGRQEIEAQTLAENARRTVLTQSATEQSEAAKMRKLSNTQNIESAKLEVELIGKTVGEQAVLRANLQAKHQLETAAASANVAINKNELKALQDQNAELKKLADAQQQLERINQATAQFIDTLVSGFVDGKSATEALSGALQGLGKQLISLGSQDLAKQLTGSIAGILGQLAPALGSAAGPVGTIVAGAGVSLIGKLFGGNDKEAQAAAQKQADELQKAQQAWAAMTQQVADFNREAAGLVKGDLTTAIEQITKTGQELQAAATKAQNFAAASELAATTVAAQTRLLNEFTASLPRLQQQLDSQGGLTGAMSAAVEKVGQFHDQIMGLRDSLIEASRLTTSDFFTGEVWSRFAASAQNAALAMIDLEHPLSDIQTQIMTLNGTALGLQDVLVQLGMSATDAAAAISDQLNKALDELRANFITDLVRKINELAGGSFINQGQDLTAQVAQLRSDAAALGVQTALIDEFYILSAQKIIDENQLVGDQFVALVNMLGLAGAGLHEFNDAVADTAKVIKRTTDEINSAIVSYQDQLFVLQQNQDTLGGKLAVFDLQAQREREAEAAKGGQAMAALEALQQAQRAKIIADWNQKQLELQQQAAKDAVEAQVKAIEAQKKAIQDQISAVQDAIKDQEKIIENAKKIWQAAVKVIEDARRNIDSFIAGFLGGTESFLSPQQQMTTAISTFNQQLALAQSGDQQALQGITGNAQSALTAIKNYFGSTAQGAALQQQILDQLQNLPDQIDPNQLIVDAVDRQTITQSQEAAAQIAKLQSQLTTLQSQLNSLNTVSTNTTATLTNLQTNTTSTLATANSTAATKTALDTANSQLTSINNAVVQLVKIESWLHNINDVISAMRAMMQWQQLYWGVQVLTSLPQYASGGVVSGSGAVPIMAHAGEMVMTRSATQKYSGVLESMNSGGGDIVSELRSTQQLLVSIARAIVSEQRTGADEIVGQLTQVVEHSRSQARTARRKEVAVQ